MLDRFKDSFIGVWHEIQVMAPRIVASLLIFLFFIWLGRLVGRTLARLLAERGESKVYLRFLQQLATWLLALLGLVLALNILGLGNLAMSLMAGGGMAAVVFGFAFREIGENFIAGFFLTFSRSFEVGDYIESEGLNGEVKTIELRHVHIRTPDGCDIFIPSARIFKSPLHNFTRDGLSRPSFVVGIDYADSPPRARKVLLETVQNTPGVLTDPPATILMSALRPQYVELQVNFWGNTFDTRYDLLEIKNQVMDRCCQALKDEGFTLSANCFSNINLAMPASTTIHLETQDQLAHRVAAGPE